MKKATLLLFFPLIKLFQWLAGIIPRGENVWIFGSYANAFNDNSKYLFTYVTESCPEIQAIWITGDIRVVEKIKAAGGRAYLRWSIAGLFTCLRGRIWFVSAYVSDVNFYCSRGAFVVNLWHGIPLKKIEFDIENGPLAAVFQRPSLLDRYVFKSSLFRRPQRVLSTSAYVSQTAFSSAFRTPIQHCLNLGYPRNDSLFWSDEIRQQWLLRWADTSLVEALEKMKRYERTYIYMPTWRDSRPNFLKEMGWDFPAIDRELAKSNSLLILKLHAATPADILEGAKNLGHIHVMKPADDAYPILPHVDALVTDYSSIYFDFLLTEKPIYFLPFDLYQYQKDSRGFYHDFNDFSPGRKIEGVRDFVATVTTDSPDEFVSARKRLRNLLHDQVDGDACARICRHFNVQLHERR